MTPDEYVFLKALREPSAAMLKAASDTPVMHSWGNGGEFITAESAADIWRAMIDVILKPAPDAQERCRADSPNR
jgi:hypothetical protein